jgi:hypothetical protein
LEYLSEDVDWLSFSLLGDIARGLMSGIPSYGEEV